MATTKRPKMGVPAVPGFRLEGEARPWSGGELFVPEAAPAPAAAPEPSGAIRRVAGDGGISLLKGAIAVPEAAVGLADIATGGRVGKALEEGVDIGGVNIGFRPREAKRMLDTMLTPEQQAANKAVQEAEGFVETTIQALRNPSVVLHAATESVPSMLGGGVIARSLLRMAPRVGAVTAAGVGEGVVAAGSQAESIRQETPDGLLTDQQAVLAGSSGAATGLLGILGGAVARRLGIADVDSLIAGKAGPETTKGFARQVLEGAVAEGLLEELPQSVQEQVAQNMALGRPLGEGVPQAAVLGALAGGLMGGGANAMSAAGAIRQEKTGSGGPVARATDTGLEAAAQAAEAIDAQAAAAQPAPMETAPVEPAVAPPQEPAPPMSDADLQRAAIAQREADKPAPPTGEPQEGDIRNADGLPFTTMQAAMRAHAKAGPGHEIVPVASGLVVRKTQARGADEPVPVESPGTAAGLPAEPEEPDPDDLPQSIRDLPKAQRELLKVRDTIERTKTAKLTNAISDEVGNRSDGELSFTPERAIMQGIKAADAARDQDGKLRSGNRTGATSDAVLRNWALKRTVDNTIAASRQESPDLWAAYDKRQAAVAELKVGDKVHTPFPSQESPLGSVGFVSRKFKVNWRIAYPDGTTVNVPPSALRPVAAAPTETTTEAPHIDEAAHQAASSPLNDLPEPTDAQKEAGNYQKGHTRISGMDVTIETPKGGERRSKADARDPWRVTMPAHYGYIKGTEGADGDHVDLFIGDKGDNGRFWVINQHHAGDSSKFDEHKVITGVDSADEAVATYKASFANGFGDKVFTSISDERSADEIKAMLPSLKKAKPVKAAVAVSTGNPDPIAEYERGRAEAPRRAWESEQATRLGLEGTSLGWGRRVGGLGDVEVEFISEPGQPVRAKVHAEYQGKRLDTREAEGDAAIKAAVDEFADKLQQGREAMARKVMADERGAPMAPTAPAVEQQAAPAPAPAPTPARARREANRASVAAAGPVFRRMVQEARNDLEDVLMNWNEAEISEDGERIVRYPGRDGRYSKGKEGGKIKGGLREFMAWLASDGPFDTSVYGEAIKTNEEWRALIERLRGIAGISAAPVAAAPDDRAVMPAGLRVTFGGKTYPVKSVEDAQRKWEAFRDSADGGGPAGVSQVGNGIRVTDGAGRFVARISYNGRVWDTEDAGPAATDATETPLEAVKQAPYYVLSPDRTGKRIPVPSPEAAAEALGKFTSRTGAEPVDGSIDVYDATTGLPAFNIRPDGTVRKVETREEAQARSRRMIEAETRTVDVPSQPKAEAPTPSANTIFTEDAAQKARARLKAKLGRLNSGIDPEMLMDGITLAGYHIEKGARTFAAYAKAMVADLGDEVKPYLQSWYMAVRSDPRAAAFKADMDKASKVEDLTAAEIDALLAPAAPAGSAIPADVRAAAKAAGQRAAADLFDWTSKVSTRAKVEIAILDHLIEQYPDGQAGASVVAKELLSELQAAPAGASGEKRMRQAMVDKALYDENPVAFFEARVEQARDALKRLGYSVNERDGTLTVWNDRTDSEVGTVDVHSDGLPTLDMPPAAVKALGAVRAEYEAWAQGEMGNPPAFEGLTEIQQQLEDEQAAGPGVETRAPTADTQGGTDGNATRELDQPSPAALGGAPSGAVRAPGEGGDAGTGADGRGRRNRRGDARSDDAGDRPAGSVGADPRDVPVPPRGTRKRPADTAQPGLFGAPGSDEGPERVRPERGGLNPVDGANPAPNAPPIPAPQATTDFTIDDDLGLGAGGEKTKFRNNVAAIRLLRELEATGRQSTPDEQRVLAKYVGWGALSQAFNPDHKDWTKEHAELKALLTPEEWDAAARSTRYAHYTSREIVVDGVYAALRRFGFTGGKTLEAGAGVGNFIGLMPADMRSAGRFTAIEREPLSSAIARHLYPQQNVQRADFTEFKGTDAYFDAAVGNPPFASDPQVDRSGRKHLSGLTLHNYFFAKAVDMLREGGVLAQVVTNSFLDAKNDTARRYIGERTRFLGAIRLPNNAFSKNANTEVTTDIIFLQKLPDSEVGSKAAKADAKRWLDTVAYTDKNGKEVALNRYFADHPDMMLGDYGAFGTMYGPDQPALVARPGQDTTALLRAAIARLPADVYRSIADTGTASQLQAAIVALKNPPVREGGYFVEGDKLIQRLTDIAGEPRGVEITPETAWTEKTKLGDAGFERIKALSEMRSTVRALIAAEMADDDKGMGQLRARLNEQYDAYREAHGLINDPGTLRVFDDDPDYPLLASLEVDYKAGIGQAAAKRMGIKATKSTAKKAAIFTRRVVAARAAVRKVDTPADALAVSMAERGKLDAAYIGELLGRDSEAVLKELSSGSDPLLFLDPATNEYVLRDAYLSGNVRAKLAQAREAGMVGNSRALEAVQPEDVGAHEIAARIGSPWVPESVYEDFARELFGENAKARVRYMRLNSSYQFNVTGANEVSLTNTWGTPKVSGDEILAALLNNKPVKVTYRDADDKIRTDVEATEAANIKAQEIRDRFGDWLFKDADRAELLVRAYNDTNNNYVTRVYDGSMMTFPGKVPDEIIKFRRHQRNAIARTVQDRTALYDHVVGAGKTFTVIASAMELKRTGLAKKPMIVVPNHLVKQWASDFYRLYPGANILTATKKDFERANRRRFLAKIATGDWDSVIIAHSSFGFIKPAPEFEATFNGKQIADIVATIKMVEDDDGDGPQKKRTVKQLEGLKERLENRIRSLRDKPMDDLLDFEQVGVDQLFVDEFHLFKNLMFSTKMQNVQGLGDSAGSQRAYDMLVKINQIFEQNGRGQGFVAATGTPVSNSLAEMYHMMRYLMPRQMEELGFGSFDAWANTFASVDQVWMQKVSGDGFKASNRMSTFVNTTELLKMFDQVCDTVTMDDIKAAYREENDGAEFPLPPLKTGRRQPISMDKSPAQEAYMQEVAKRAKALEQRRGPPKKGEDNTLVIMSDARKAAMDIRLVDPDITEREKGGRIDRASEEIAARYRQYDTVKGTQVVFSDLGTPIKHAKAEMKEYEALRDRIAKATDDVAADAALGDEAAKAVLEDAEEAQAELDAKGSDWLDAVKAALRGFSVYDDLRAALVERGIPDAEIAFIHDYNTDDQKAGLFKKVNAGQIRVLIGSTAKMGAGTNVQERLVAEHHLDVPWRPSDVEQREGRIIRQGNVLVPVPGKNDGIPGFEVEILAYVTRDTLDMRMWQVQETKLKMINQLRTRKVNREVDNAFEDMEMSAGEMQAAATGNMDLLKEIQLRTDVKALERRQRAFDAQAADLQSRRNRAERMAATAPLEVKKWKPWAEAARVYAEEQSKDREISVTVNGTEYTSDRLAGEAIRKLLGEHQARLDARKAGQDAAREAAKAEFPGDDGESAAKRLEAVEAFAKANPMPKLAIDFNGKVFSSKTAVAEAFVETVGDGQRFDWMFDGKAYIHRNKAADAMADQVMEAGEAQTEQEIGSFGPFTVSVEGLTSKVAGARLDVIVRYNGMTISDDIRFWSISEAENAGRANALAAMERAQTLVASAGSKLYYAEHDVTRAAKALEDLGEVKEAGEWPDKPKLDAARAAHKEVLARLNAKPAAAPEAPSDEPGETLASLGFRPRGRRAPPMVATALTPEGLPEFATDAVTLAFPQSAERFEVIPESGQQVVSYAIMPPDGFDVLGHVELLVQDGKAVSLLDIEVYQDRGRGRGIGRATIEALLAANPDADLNISNIVPEARGFWERMGIPQQNVEGAYDGTLNWKTYAEIGSAPRQDPQEGGAARRGSRPGGEGQGRGVAGEDGQVEEGGPASLGFKAPLRQAGHMTHAEATQLLYAAGYAVEWDARGVPLLRHGGELVEYATFPPGRLKNAWNILHIDEDDPNWEGERSSTGGYQSPSFERMGEQIARQGYERTNVPRMQAARRLRKLLADRKAGTLSAEGFEAAVDTLTDKMTAASDAKQANRLMSERERGADIVREKLIRARRTGDLDEETVGFALWALDQNPAIATDLGISLVSPKDGTPAGDYNPAARVVRLFKGEGKSDTAVHEILHHTERMLPPEVQAGIRAEWGKAVGRALKAAQGNPEQLAAIEDMLFASAGNKPAWERTVQAFKDGRLDYRQHYQLFNASEFWAVNGARILEGRYQADGWVAKARQWLRDMVEYVKGALGLRSDAPVLRALQAVLATDGARRSGQMLSAGAGRAASLGFKDAMTAAAASARDVRLPAQYRVGDLFDSQGTLHWWHKTVGTMHNLAARSPMFRRVYDAAQNFIGDVSYYATEAADLAPRILPKLEQWRDVFKSPLPPEDAKAIAAPIFEGTLVWARDADGKPVKVAELEARAERMSVHQKAQEMLRRKLIDPKVLKMWQAMPIDQYEAAIATRYERQVLKQGVVWKDSELRDMFGMNTEQIGLYREFRKAIDKSLTNLAISDMVRYAGDDAAPIRERVLATGDVQKAAGLLREYLFRLAEMDQDRAGVLNDTANRITEKGDRARDLMDRGYAPLSRFGQYTLDVVDEAGERVYFGLFETARERARMMRQMRAEYPEASIAAGTVSQEAYRLFAGVSPETVELFGEMLGLEVQGDDAASKAFQTYVKLAKSNRSAMKRMLERKGIAGYSEDAGRVLAGFVYSNARQTASNLHMGELGDAVAAIPKGDGELQDAAVRLAEYIKNPQEEAQALRGLLFAQYLGGSVASALVNMTQPATVTLPYLSQFGGAAKAAARLGRAARQVNKKATGDERLDAALHKAEEEGIVSPQEVHQLMAQAMGRASLRSGDGTTAGNAAAKVSNRLAILGFAWGKLFGMAEQVNRRITFIAAYRTAVDEKLGDPEAFARKAVTETQFVYNKGNKPRWARGAIGSTLFTFKQYSISYLELMNRMWNAGSEGSPERAAGRKAVLLGLAVLFLAGGADGLPFMEDAEDVIDGILQRLGYNFSTKQAKREFLVSYLGEGGAEFVRNGISGLPGVPIDVSGRMGMGNLIPGTGLLTKRTDQTRNAVEILGPLGDFATRAFKAAGLLVDGSPVKAVQTVSPIAAQNAIKALDMASTGMYRDDRGRKVIDTDGYEWVAKAIGFQPANVARVQEATRTVQGMIAQNKMREAEIAEQWAIGVFEGDKAKQQAAKDALARWNKNNPTSPIKITMPQVIKRVRAMRQGKTERLAKTAPREIRAQVQRELAAAEED